MANQQKLSAEDRAALSAMLEAPEVIEVHGNDSSWQHGLIGSLLSASAMTFAMAAAPAAHADGLFERTLSSIATSTATSVAGNFVRQGIQGTADTVKRAVTGQPQQQGNTIFNQGQNQSQGQLQPGTTIFNQQPRSAQAVPGVVVSGGAPRADSRSASPGLTDRLGAALGFGGNAVPNDTNDLAQLMQRNDVDSIAATSKLRPVLFPVVVRAGASEYEQFGDAARHVTSVVPAGPNGPAMIRDGLLQKSNPSRGPAAAAIYVGDQKNTGACMIVMHSGQADYAVKMSQMTGLSMKEAMDFAVVHEAAHCAQQGETLAAQYDAATGKSSEARMRMAYSGLVDVHTETAIKSGNMNRLANPKTLDKAERSAERYADAFAALALNAQQPLSGQQWNGIAAWRMTTGQGHDTSNFVRWVQDQVQRDSVAREAMRSQSGAGYNAAAVAAFLKPIWKTFESREAELEQSRERANQGSRPGDRVAQALGYGARGQTQNDDEIGKLVSSLPRPR